MPILLAGWLAVPAGALWAQPAPVSKLTYAVEWRLIRGGTVVVDLPRSTAASPSQARVKIDSAGLVTALYKVDDTYDVQFGDNLCATATTLDALQGRRHRRVEVRYERALKRGFYNERDVLRGTVLRTAEIDVPACVHDVLGGLLMLRGMNLEPGQNTQIPMSDGRRFAQVRVDSQTHEDVTTPAGQFKATRYEAFLMSGVVYPRNGRVFIWISDDERRLPVQMQIRLNFPIGTVTLRLEKESPP